MSEEKIGMYSTEEIYEELANGFLHHSMVDAMYFKIKDLQQKVEQLENIRKEAIEYLESDENIIDRFWKHDFRKYPDYNPFEAKDEEEVRCVELYGYDDLLNILNKGSEE